VLNVNFQREQDLDPNNSQCSLALQSLLYEYSFVYFNNSVGDFFIEYFLFLLRAIPTSINV